MHGQALRMTGRVRDIRFRVITTGHTPDRGRPPFYGMDDFEQLGRRLHRRTGYTGDGGLGAPYTRVTIRPV